MPADNWGTSLRDVLTDFLYELEVGELNATVRAFGEADGEPYASPYDNIRNRLDRTIGTHRVETWKKLFELIGLVHVDAGTLHLSPFGRYFLDTWKEADLQVQAANRGLAKYAVRVLGRYQLLNPTSTNLDYPADCDVFPFRTLWQAMLALDNRLHHEELNRVLLRVMHQDQIAPAIERIRAAREAGYDPNDDAQADTHLGPRVYPAADQATRRMTPWFSAAGFGGLLIDREADAQGYRSIRDEYRSLVAAEVATAVPYRDFGNDRQAWFAYLSAPPHLGGVGDATASDAELLERALECCRRFGASRFILFSGVAGTGKTRMADMVASILSEGDPGRRFEVQFYENYAYEDFVEALEPTAEGGFKPAKRAFRRANEAAQQLEKTAPGARVVLLVEEFSRANLSNVLGEVLTYIEHRGRRFTFPLSSEEDYVSPNLVILGTMNPLDRSVVEMDDALIRRTRRIEFRYSEAALRDMLAANSVDAAVIDALAAALAPLAADLPFGHGVFADVTSEEDLHFLWTEQLQQYFVRASGYRREDYDRFTRSYPWIDPKHRTPVAAVPAVGEPVAEPAAAPAAVPSEVVEEAAGGDNP